jgi:hypothetical protein
MAKRDVFSSVSMAAPHLDAGLLDVPVEAVPPEVGVVEQADDAPVEPAGHLGPRVHAPETDLRVRPHLRRLAPLRHQPLAEAHHDGVVLGQLARQVPETLAHRVGRDGVGILLDLVHAGPVEVGAGPEVGEDLRPERRHGAGHREQPLHPAVHERHFVGELGRRLAAAPLNVDILEPEVEPAEDGTCVE